MNIIFIFLLIIIIILITYSSRENFSIKLPTFYLKDINSNKYLVMGDNGYVNFKSTTDYGVKLLISENPNQYLPLRLANSPNHYLLATLNGNGIRTVTNPYAIQYQLEIYIYNNFNIIGYVNDANNPYYIVVDNYGNITSTNNPDLASRFIVEVL